MSFRVFCSDVDVQILRRLAKSFRVFVSRYGVIAIALPVRLLVGLGEEYIGAGNASIVKN